MDKETITKMKIGWYGTQTGIFGSMGVANTAVLLPACNDSNLFLTTLYISLIVVPYVLSAISAQVAKQYTQQLNEQKIKISNSDLEKVLKE